MPRISVVTISFNQLDYLTRCVESIRAQGFSDYEHIIVDPGSTDGSREWLTENESPRTRVIFQPDDGPSQGLNHGLSACRGEIFMYLNSDDELAPGALDAVNAVHEMHPQVDVVIGNGWTIDIEGKPIDYVRSDPFSPLRYSLSIGNIMQQSTSFKSRLFDAGLSFNESNKSVWDTELLFDAHSMNAKFMNVNACIGYFRLHPDSITVSQRHAQDIRNHQRRMISESLGPVVYSLNRPLSYFCRAGKKLRNTVLSLRSAPVFPGRSG